MLLNIYSIIIDEYNNSDKLFVLLRCGPAKCQCCIKTVTVVVYCIIQQFATVNFDRLPSQPFSTYLFKTLEHQRFVPYCLQESH